MALAATLIAHLSLTQIRGLQAEQRIAKPLTTQFVKRQPRLTKPLELKKRPQPKRRQIQRKMVAVKARMQAAQQAAGFQPTQVLGRLARPSAQIGRMAGLGSVEMEPQSVAGIIEGSKEVEQKIDMSLELLDIQALDTGQYHALVVQDPEDKSNVKGFCRLAVVYSEAMSGRRYPGSGQTYFERYVVPVIRTVADAICRPRPRADFSRA